MMRGNYLGLTHLMISLTSSYFLYLKDGKSIDVIHLAEMNI